MRREWLNGALFKQMQTGSFNLVEPHVQKAVPEAVVPNTVIGVEIVGERLREKRRILIEQIVDAQRNPQIQIAHPPTAGTDDAIAQGRIENADRPPTPRRARGTGNLKK